MSTCTSSAALAERHAVLSLRIKHARRNIRPRSVAHRVRALYCAADLACPGLVCSELDRPLASLARQEWQRPLWAWNGEAGFGGLLRHLLVTVRYPLSATILDLPRTTPFDSDRCMAIVALLGRGGGLRQAREQGFLPSCLTRAMEHQVLLLEGPLPLPLLLRTAQVRALGGPEALIPALMATRLGSLDTGEPRRQEVIAWLCREPPLGAHLGEVVDWLEAHPGRNLRGLTADGAIRASRRWHAERPPPYRALAAASELFGPLPRCGLEGARIRQGEQLWRIEEIETGEDLAAEGAAMHHCVASYASLIRQGTSAIFGVRSEGVRILTVEVRPQQGQVVQIRGLANRLPSPAEALQIIRRWAESAGLVIALIRGSGREVRYPGAVAEAEVQVATPQRKQRRRRILGCLGGALLLLAVLVVVQISFRRPVGPVDLAAVAAEVPADIAALEGWLGAQEARFDDIDPGTEKHVAWAGEAGRRTPLSLVYLHGFSATRQEVSPLCERLGAALGANVFFTRLAGHGRDEAAMAEPSAEDWLRDAAEAYEVGRRLGERVVVIGTSTGGTLAAWLAVQQPPDLAAVVYLSPNFGPKAAGSQMLLWPGREVLVDLIIGPYREWQPATPLQAQYWTWRYPSEALFPMMELVDHVDRLPLERATQPALVLYSPEDQVLDTRKIEENFAELGGRPRRLEVVTGSTDPSQHVLAGDALSPQSTDAMVTEILGFLRGEAGVAP